MNQIYRTTQFGIIGQFLSYFKCHRQQELFPPTSTLVIAINICSMNAEKPIY